MVRTKVFVGNLSFKTGEKELAQEFEVAGKVASANIISRGSRSLGYGFVEMESEDEARKAVELLNKKLIDSREINVEVARPREENPDRNNPDRNNPDAAPGVGQRRRSGSGRKFFRQRRGGNNNVQGGPPQLDANGVPIPNAPNNNNNRGPNINGDNQLGGSPSGRGGGRGGRGPRRGGRFPRGGGSTRPPRPDRPVKVAPPNSVFVANLPFKLDDDGLSSVFVNLTLKEAVKSSHVVKDRLGFSKGYGFVEFSNPDDQQKALTADKSVVDAREIIVKAAFTEPPPPKNNNNNAGASATPGEEVVVKA